MSKVQQHCLKIAVQRGDLKLRCKLALMQSVENKYTNLDNAYSKVREHVTPAQWAGYLSALTKEGVYGPVVGYPGWGKME